MSNTVDEDYHINLLIVGDSGVGKTCFLLRFSDNNFTDINLSTIGIDFKMKTINTHGKPFQLKIWDTAGQERFRTITKNFYKDAMGVILVYDCTNGNSFENIRTWVQQINIHASDSISKILIGNKCDMPNKMVSFKQGQDLAQVYNIQFFETSAKNNINVVETFDFIVNEIVERKIKMGNNGNRLSIRISDAHKEKKHRKCCRN